MNDKNSLIEQFEKDRDGFQKTISKQISEDQTISVAFRSIFHILFHYFDKNAISLALQAYRSLIDPLFLFSYVSSKVDKEEFLSAEMPFPPFDLFVICALLSLEGSDVDVQNRIFCLFEFHRQLLSILRKNSSKTETVFLNDLFDPKPLTVAEATEIENRRVLYLTELLVILYHSMPPNQLIANFVDTVFSRSDEIEPSDEIYSVIGRILLSNGEVEKAQDFFEKVNSDMYRKLNEAFLKFFKGNYSEAEKIFKEIDTPIAKVNRAASLVFLGKIDDAKIILKKAVQQDETLKLFKSVNDNLMFLKELTDESQMNESESYFNFPSNSFAVRNPH